MDHDLKGVSGMTLEGPARVRQQVELAAIVKLP